MFVQIGSIPHGVATSSRPRWLPRTRSPIPPSTNTEENEGREAQQQRGLYYKGIIFPEREYGYRSTKLTWDELKNIILVEYNLAKLSRSLEQQYDYEIFLRSMKNEWKSTYDFMEVSLFSQDHR